MKFVDDFEKREWLGRQALKELQELYPDFFKWDIKFTNGKYDCFDADWFIMEDYSIKKRVWVEIKCRDVDYDELILEKKKLKKMIDFRNSLYLSEDQVMILYLNFTPNKTIIFKLDESMLKETKKLKANKATSVDRDNKINKDVIYLSDDIGKTFDYRINERRLMCKYDTEYLLPKIKNKLSNNNDLWNVFIS